MPARSQQPEHADQTRKPTPNWPVNADLIPNEGRSLRYRVADVLRQAIIEGELQPGARILEEETSQRLGLSRGPVREGMRVLEQEGFVMSFPNRGTVVLPLTEEEVREVLIPIRLVLERFAFRLAMQEATPEALEPFEDVLSRMRKAAERQDRYAVAEADIAFHRQVFRLAGHYHSLSIWNAIAPRAKAYFVRYPATLDLDKTVRDHELLLDALRNRDLEYLQELLVPHITLTGLDTDAMNASIGQAAETDDQGSRRPRERASG
jgi:DNA-binding GntR family transcriptional regulator